MLEKRWVIRDTLSDSCAAAFSEYNSVIAQLLYNRGITSREAADAFLHPDATPLADPLLLKDMDKAVERIRKAIGTQEKIVVYGDYDVDGVCSTVIVGQLIKQLGGLVSFYIPERVEEGYGLNREAIEKLAHSGTRLLITVDCGIASRLEVATANSLGMDVIITDHHHVPDELPQACAIINPKQAGCSYPFKELAGAGVAYQLVRALEQSYDTSSSHDPIDLVALATVADIVPLVGENRSIVARGLQVINAAQRIGLRALIEASGYEPGQIDSYHLGFHLGPRLNAAGRLAHARTAVRLFLSTDTAEADRLARELTDLNTERQALTQEILALADAQAQEQLAERLLIVRGEEWPAGVVGLVAGKLCERYYRPVIVMEQGSEMSRGSARSISGFHITEALTACESLLVRYGGHAMAAGFELQNTELPAFIRCMQTQAQAGLRDEDLLPELSIDADIPLAAITYDLYHILEQCRPFGYGNPRPVFLTRRVRKDDLRLMGRENDHLRLRVSQDGNAISAVGFSLGELFAELEEADRLDIVYTIDENEWQGVCSLQLTLKDVRPAAS